MRLVRQLFTVTGLILLSAGYAHADDIKLVNQAFKEVAVVNAKGEKEFKLVEPGTVVPKDEILYITTFANTGDQPATDIVITNPLPNNSRYKAGSAFGAGTEISYSVDGGKSYGTPETLKVSGSAGQTRAAGPDDYTHIRWVYTGELAPGAESTVTFRTIIK